MTVAIGFSTTKSITSRFIRWITRSRFSHSYVRYTNGNLKAEMVIDADPRGIIEKPLERVYGENSSWVELVPPTREKKRLLKRNLQFLAPTLGTEFDYLSFFGRAVVIIGDFFRKKWKNPLSNKRKDICVENCLRLAVGAEPSLWRLDWESETPESLYEKLVDLGWVEIPKQ